MTTYNFELKMKFEKKNQIYKRIQNKKSKSNEWGLDLKK
jgi:hypothetical protein